MKIICIGRNYAEHAKEMNSAVPSEPVFFLKPDTALLKNHGTFYIPDFSSDIHHEIEIVLKICKNGKHIQKEFAHKYYDEIGIGIDFTARDIQSQCKEKGLPWEKAKAFDNSAAVGNFFSKNTLNGRNELDFCLHVNGKTIQRGNTRDLIFSFEHIVSYISTFITLKTGDLIYTGTPKGVGPVKTGDILEGYFENNKALEVFIK